MLPEAWIRLEAIDRARNVYRSWRSEIDRDLFGLTLVSVTFGRISAEGRTILRAGADESAALTLVRHSLARRATSLKRCGSRPIAWWRAKGSTGWAWSSDSFVFVTLSAMIAVVELAVVRSLARA